MANTEAAHSPSGLGIHARTAKLVAASNLLGLIVAFILLVSFFGWRLHGQFLNYLNLQTVAINGTVVAVATLGMTLVIVAGMIDLSVGSTVALVTVVVAMALQNHGPVFALVMGLLAGAATGLFNGLVITKVKVMPFIVTLGTMALFRGIARGLAHENTVEAPKTWILKLLEVLPQNESWRVLPSGVWIMAGLAVIVGILLRGTVFGRHIVAVGSNEVAAKMSGVNPNTVKLLVFLIAGVFFGVAGVMDFSFVHTGDPVGAQGLELDVIAAAVIGGASLSGGQGSILGSIIGAFFMATMANGLVQMGLAEWVQLLAKGTIIVLAVALDRLRVRSG